MGKRRNSSEAIGVLGELESIKRLLMLALLRSGASQGEVARALGVTQSSVSRMLPGRFSRAANTR